MASHDPEDSSTFQLSDEGEPLLPLVRETKNFAIHEDEDSSTNDTHETDTHENEVVLTKRQSWSLYLSHFLSTWNARGYEFAAIIFTASAYPETLMASSIRGIITTIATLALSASVGRWCDTHPSRLQTLRITIFLQRTCVVLACLGWFFIVGEEFLGGGLFSVMPVPASRKGGQAGILDGNWLAKAAIMAVVMTLGIGERLSAVGNMIVMERDWVPRLATGTSKPSLPELNAVMRRIDLICKLLSPIFMSAIVLWTSSMRVTILITAGINFLSMGIEWFAARRVWRECERLQAPKALDAEQTGDGSGNMFKLERWRQSLNIFFRSEIWIPSLSLGLLYVSVLSFSASMITYLLNAGFTLSVITIARTGSTLLEVSSTVVMPWSVKFMEKAAAWRARRGDGTTQSAAGEAAAVERTGLWGLWWMVINLIPVTVVLFYIPVDSDDRPSSLLMSSLFMFLAFSRLGLWTYDLVSQTLVQTRIPATNIGEFSGVEMGFINTFELIQWVLIAIWSSPEQFKYVAAAGNACVVISAIAYTAWMWTCRGHLVHWEKVKECTGCK
ncbi:uncharacterized protein LAJ45_07267 [Morchella importuna]|uniref:uncharacterized protein n=1 Tax=Morchella importuna TaxID=1174673 RepID=UPI001E8D7432|nr:uncharacterized protein LAJ45_07267 [Morchella importuna]KAH8148556.1 hypothetical protein LAJ45_07267 [Morchella importuna]